MGKIESKILPILMEPFKKAYFFSRVFPTFATSYIRGFGASEGVSEGVGAILGLSWGHLWRFRDSEIRRFGDAGIQNSWILVLSSFIEVGLE